MFLCQPCSFLEAGQGNGSGLCGGNQEVGVRIRLKDCEINGMKRGDCGFLRYSRYSVNMFPASHQSPEVLSYIEIDKIFTQYSDQTSRYIELLLIRIRIKPNQDAWWIGTLAPCRWISSCPLSRPFLHPQHPTSAVQIYQTSVAQLSGIRQGSCVEQTPCLSGCNED
jgi:hypothetical protein